jgi:Transcriptional regulator
MSPRVSDDYKDQKRQKILEAAKSVFVRKGYRAVTMKDVIDESGLSRGGVYLYFSSPEEIFLSLIDASDEDYSSLIEQLITNSKTAWEALLKLVRAVTENIACIEEGLSAAIYEYFLVVKGEGNARDLLKRRFHKAIIALRTILEKGVENGEFHPRFSIDEISKFLLFVMDGLSINMLSLSGENINLSKQAAQLVLYLQHALQIESCELSSEMD